MTGPITCEGAPRDLGFDQGTQCRAELGAAYRKRSRWQRARDRVLAASRASRQLRREIRRFHPQQAEMIDAMARAARVPARWLFSLLARQPAFAPAAPELLLAAEASMTDRGGLLARTLPADAIVRRSRPESGFRSIELAQPWCVAPLAGVNEAGLAIACVSKPTTRADARSAAPASLLAVDCLRRFDGLDGAIDWLLARPAGGRSMWVLADASGDIAGVRVDADVRRIFRPADGLVFDCGAHARQLEIEKALREASPLLGSDLARFFGMPLVAVAPGRRSIGLLSANPAGEADRWFGV